MFCSTSRYSTKRASTWPASGTAFLARSWARSDECKMASLRSAVTPLTNDTISEPTTVAWFLAESSAVSTTSLGTAAARRRICGSFALATKRRALAAVTRWRRPRAGCLDVAFNMRTTIVVPPCSRPSRQSAQANTFHRFMALEPNRFGDWGYCCDGSARRMALNQPA